MTDQQPPTEAQVEDYLRRSLQAAAAPAAPETIVAHVARLAESDTEPGPRWTFQPSMVIGWLAIAVSLALVGVVLFVVPGPRHSGPYVPGLPSLSPGTGVAGPSAASATCDVSASILHGTWWREIGGPNAFFQWDDGPRSANPDQWLPIVRFNPDAASGETVAMWAERLDTGQRVPGQLNSRADPHLVYRFSSPAPDLPGGWYLFQQALPSAGCWRLSAAINGRVVGTAVVAIGASASASPESSVAPTPHVAGEPASSCAGGSWPATVISCDTVFRLGNQAGAQVDRTRIWLTTLGAVKASMHPFQQVIEPAEPAKVWVIVYDGSWWCCTNAFDPSGNLIPQVHQTRWLVVAEAAATAGTEYVYLQDWTGKTVPDFLQLPAP